MLDQKIMVRVTSPVRKELESLALSLGLDVATLVRYIIRHFLAATDPESPNGCQALSEFRDAIPRYKFADACPVVLVTSKSPHDPIWR